MVSEPSLFLVMVCEGRATSALSSSSSAQSVRLRFVSIGAMGRAVEVWAYPAGRDMFSVREW
jgi:hypothetical protein